MYNVVNALRKGVIFCLFHSPRVFGSNPHSQQAFCSRRKSNNQQVIMIIIVVNTFSFYVDANDVRYIRNMYILLMTFALMGYV